MIMTVFALLVTAAGFGALVAGGPVERRGALMFAAAWLAALAARNLPGEDRWLFLIDLAVLVGLIALCWKAPRPWPVYACGFQLLVLAARVAGWVDPDVDPGRHLALVSILQGVTIGMLVLGAWSPPRASERRATK